MFNPMLATVLLGGCKGNSTWEHIMIYWVGATIGAVVASLIYPKLKQFAYPNTQKGYMKEETTKKTSAKKQKSS